MICAEGTLKKFYLSQVEIGRKLFAWCRGVEFRSGRAVLEHPGAIPELIARAKLWIAASVILPHAEDDVESVLSPAPQRLGMACAPGRRSMNAPGELAHHRGFRRGEVVHNQRWLGL